MVDVGPSVVTVGRMGVGESSSLSTSIDVDVAPMTATPLAALLAMPFESPFASPLEVNMVLSRFLLSLACCFLCRAASASATFKSASMASVDLDCESGAFFLEDVDADDELEGGDVGIATDEDEDEGDGFSVNKNFLLASSASFCLCTFSSSVKSFGSSTYWGAVMDLAL